LPKLSTSSYRLLSAFRYEIRKFVSFSEQAAREAEIEPQQHQLLLAVRGLPEGVRPTIGAVAERLCVQHHTAVALTDKLEARELLSRQRSASDKREVLLKLTAEGDAVLRTLSARHWEQLAVAGPAMVAGLQELVTLANGGRPETLKDPSNQVKRSAKPKTSPRASVVLRAPRAAKATRSK
jgi:DNA-binding MarR family transcriptional regulator